MLILFGIGFILVENGHKGKRARVRSLAQLTYKDAVIIGLFQLIAAIFPGTSRSGATILGGLMIGVSRTVAAEFTFFLAIPVMLGGEPVKGDPLRLCFFNGGGSDPAGWHGNCFYCIRACDPLPDGLHQKT